MTRFLDRHRIDVPTIVTGIGCGALLFVIVNALVPWGMTRKVSTVPVEEPGPSIETVEPGVVDARLRVQEGHIVELRNRVRALEKAIGEGTP